MGRNVYRHKSSEPERLNFIALGGLGEIGRICMFLNTAKK